MQLPYRKPGKYSQQAPDPIISEEKFLTLKKELDTLYKKRPHAAAEVSRLAEMGDFSENVEYQLAKGRLRGINDAITRLEYQINHAEVISPRKNTTTIHIGHTVTISNEKGQLSYTILGSAETDPLKGIISHTSPIGSALLGHSVGEVITITLANKKVAYTIVQIT